MPDKNSFHTVCSNVDQYLNPGSVITKSRHYFMTFDTGNNKMLKTVQVVVLLNLANCFSQCIATHPKSGPKWSIYDLLDELGLKSFSGLLETTGFMYTLSENASGL